MIAPATTQRCGPGVPCSHSVHVRVIRDTVREPVTWSRSPSLDGLDSDSSHRGVTPLPAPFPLAPSGEGSPLPPPEELLLREWAFGPPGPAPRRAWANPARDEAPRAFPPPLGMGGRGPGRLPDPVREPPQPCP